MSALLYGMLGALIVDAALVVVAALVLPGIVRRAMQKKMGLALAGQYGAAGAFAKKPAGS